MKGNINSFKEKDSETQMPAPLLTTADTTRTPEN